MDAQNARAGLVRILQLAYSGERAAAYAYRGHWKSLSAPEQRARVRQIEEEEWHHRSLVRGLLEELGARPDRWREMRALVVGRTLGALCHAAGWFLPMYGAGRLERRNIVEYEEAARFATRSGCGRFLDCLLAMAEVEWDHEQYFRAQVTGNRWTRLLPVWSPPPPRESIRVTYLGAPGNVA